MKSSAKRAFSLLVSAAFLISAFAVYGARIKPLYDEATVLRGTMFAKQSLFEKKRQAVEKIENLIKQYQGSGQLQNSIGMSLPYGEEMSSVFNQLQAIAAMNGIAIQVFNVQALPLKPAREGSLARPLGTLRLSLRLVGSYGAFKDFVRGLETNIRVMDIVTMKIEPAGANRQDIFAYTVVADAYYQE